MFESLVSGTLDPAVVKYLRLVKDALRGVEDRLHDQVASGEPVRVLAAQAQLDVIAAWGPAVDEMLRALEPKPAAPHVGVHSGGKS